jgi:deoxyadenosine/deoxycytidine kinase
VDSLSNDINLDLGQYELPRFIAVEGSIGVGKTTLAKRLAKTFNYDTLLEQAEENPFLEKFYRDRASAALPTQLFFLFQRVRQLQALRQGDMFQPLRIADFLMDKDPIFAGVTLDDNELNLYRMVFQQLTLDAPTPDLVIYLQASTEVLMERIKRRGNAMEQHISPEYLTALNDAYTDFFYYYERAPLLIINATEIDIVNSDADYRNLVEYLLRVKTGRHYFNPAPHG